MENRDKEMQEKAHQYCIEQQAIKGIGCNNARYQAYTSGYAQALKDNAGWIDADMIQAFYEGFSRKGFAAYSWLEEYKKDKQTTT